MTALVSWVPSANGHSEFPVENCPYGVFDDGQGARLGIAIGDYVLDVAKVDHGLDAALFEVKTWNRFMEAGQQVWARFRARMQQLFTDERYRAQVETHLVSRSNVRLLLPLEVREYTDFYAGKNHAFNVGTMFRGPENALPPNWLSIPIGYNGRASSVVVSGTPVRRPWGQVKGKDFDLPSFQPSRRFDFELELGAVVGTPSNGMVSVDEADEMIFGFVLLNDWSARDIQAWEYQPLGPFQAKATATTISPWIVPKAALAPFMVETPKRERPLLAYLAESRAMLPAIDLEVVLQPEGRAETIISRTNSSALYYSPAQQLCHHTSSGCPMRAGDLLGSGTISGTDKSAYGSMLELSWGGETPVPLADGSLRTFLEDGDTVIMRGHARGDGFTIGFGECRGALLPPIDLPDWAKEKDKD